MRVFELPRDGATWACLTCHRDFLPSKIVLLLHDNNDHEKRCLECCGETLEAQDLALTHTPESAKAWETYILGRRR